MSKNQKQWGKPTKIANIDRQRNFSNLLNDLRNLNEIFMKNVTYDNIESHKKPAFHSLFRRYVFCLIRSTLLQVWFPTPPPTPTPTPTRFRVKVLFHCITDVLWTRWESSYRQKMDGCFFQQILWQNVSWVLS